MINLLCSESIYIYRATFNIVSFFLQDLLTEGEKKTNADRQNVVLINN